MAPFKPTFALRKTSLFDTKSENAHYHVFIKLVTNRTCYSIKKVDVNKL